MNGLLLKTATGTINQARPQSGEPRYVVFKKALKSRTLGRKDYEIKEFFLFCLPYLKGDKPMDELRGEKFIRDGFTSKVSAKMSKTKNAIDIARQKALDRLDTNFKINTKDGILPCEWY